MRLLALVIPLGVSACSSQQTTYIGNLQPIAGVCDPSARAELTLRGKSVLFIPNSGTISLTGVKTGASIVATKTLVGADKKPYKLAFSGTLQGRTILGTYKIARCQYNVSLSPIAD